MLPAIPFAACSAKMLPAGPGSGAYPLSGPTFMRGFLRWRCPNGSIFAAPFRYWPFFWR